jgi:hypothetical protein
MVAQNKIVIAGTGRAGTTFLVQLLTELGLETGFTKENSRGHYYDHCSAGLEWELTAPDAPRIVKNPALTLTLPELWRAGKAPPIEHVLIPIRDLQSAASSRVRVGMAANAGAGTTSRADASATGSAHEIPGGLWLTSKPERQAEALAVAFHEFIHALAKEGVPFTLLTFPRFATDAEYCFSQLKFLLGGMTREQFDAAFRRCARPELIHVFDEEKTQSDPAVLASYKAQQTKKRRARRLRRAQRIAAGCVASLVTLGAVYLILQGR